MTYLQAIEFIHSRPRFSKKAGLDTMKMLMQRLDNPQDTLKFVHIAGTNGKGSCAAMLANVLQTAGYKVGLNISPYIISFCERFQINGKMIAEQQLADLTERLKLACEAMPSEYQPNEFEAVTAIGFLYFAQEKCDIVCLEVGLGGKFDPTNIIKTTQVSCIMKIGIDHTAQLGETITAIAAEKAGIIKPNTTVISYPSQPSEAVQVLDKIAGDKNTKVIYPDLQDLKLFKGDAFHNAIDYGGYQITVPFIGEHQAKNATVVIETALVLCEKGYEVSDEAIINGIENAKFPARIEIISKNPLIILDGCHNADSTLALASTLKKASLTDMTAVIGVLKDKDPTAMLKMLKPFFSTVYTVTVDNPRAMQAIELAQIADTMFDTVVASKDIKTAITSATKKISSDSGVCVCGSLYLAAQARDILLNL